MPGNPIIKTVVIVIAVLVLGIIAAMLISGGLPFSQTPSNNSTSTKTASNVLFPPDYDVSGRNLYYQTMAGKLGPLSYGKRALFAGVGPFPFDEFVVFAKEKSELTAQVLEPKLEYSVGIFSKEELPKSLDRNNVITDTTPAEMTQYIVGVLDKWEDIPNSGDKILILKDPMQLRDDKGGLIQFPRIRVGFGERTDGVSEFVTNLHVEDLSKVIPKFDTTLKAVPSYRIGSINSLSTEQVYTLIKPGDAIAVKLFLDLKNNKDFVDSNNTKVASDLFIRRFNPFDIEKEAGIVLNK